MRLEPCDDGLEVVYGERRRVGVDFLVGSHGRVQVLTEFLEFLYVCGNVGGHDIPPEKCSGTTVAVPLVFWFANSQKVTR